jgi:hypothetical protein
VPGPGGEPFPQPDDLLRAEPVAGERFAGHLVQLPDGVGEVPAGQAGIQALGKGNELTWGVALQGGRRVDVVTRFYPAGFSELTLVGQVGAGRGRGHAADYWAICSSRSLELLGPNTAMSMTTTAMRIQMMPKLASRPYGRKTVVIMYVNREVDRRLTL